MAERQNWSYPMVTIRIVVEGGVLPNANKGAATIANSERLREAFH